MRLLKAISPLTLVLALAGACCAQAAKATEKPPAIKMSSVQPSPEWDKIKSLAGTWDGTAGTMKSEITYKVTAAGSAVLLMMPSDKPGDEMVTMFHPDGKEILVTHYCSAKNQPRMKLVPSSNPNELRFKFMDITNLTSPDQGHMKEVAILFDGPDHHVQEWTFDANGKTMVEKFDFRRKK